MAAIYVLYIDLTNTVEVELVYGTDQYWTFLNNYPFLNSYCSALRFLSVYMKRNYCNTVLYMCVRYFSLDHADFSQECKFRIHYLDLWVK